MQHQLSKLADGQVVGAQPLDAGLAEILGRGVDLGVVVLEVAAAAAGEHRLDDVQVFPGQLSTDDVVEHFLGVGVVLVVVLRLPHGDHLEWLKIRK